ncbi:MAG TPA: LysM peptidoglycan-binding domain-containing protein, partial [Myxococcaceae bacterium]|nr:LysM peptidoglycan-binding domain-containing protein [Myxococcaceae bacterium]
MSGPSAADGIGGAAQGGRRTPRHLDADGLYTVQPGDNLSAIARDLLGDAKRYQELAVANDIADPSKLPAYKHGKPTRLKMPNGAAAPKSPAPTQSPAPSGQPPPGASAEQAKAADPDWMPPQSEIQRATGPTKPDDFKPRPLPVPMNTNYPPLDPTHLPHTGPAAALAHRAAPGAASLDPTELLKLVKNGDVDLTVPIPAGPLGSGSTKVTAAPGTVAKLTVHVSNGQLDFAKTKVSFQPSLKAPAGLSVKGAYIDGKGDLSISLSGVLSVFGDVHLETRLPSDLPGLIKKIQDEEGKPLSTRMGWFIPLGSHPVIPKFDPKVQLP